MNEDQSVSLEWRDGVPISEHFNDPYYSLENGLAEAEHVFLRGNGLPARFRAGFHVAELGFGTGLNLAVTLRAWQQSGAAGLLRYTAFEAFPLRVHDMERALGVFPPIVPEMKSILAALDNGKTHHRTETLDFRLVIGDARVTVPRWDGKADAWFLDGFAPSRNPELWEAPLLVAVSSKTATKGTLATYTAAGYVRRTLVDVGFDVQRVKGFGRKRHMTVGVRI